MGIFNGEGFSFLPVDQFSDRERRVGIQAARRFEASDRKITWVNQKSIDAWIEGHPVVFKSGPTVYPRIDDNGVLLEPYNKNSKRTPPPAPVPKRKREPETPIPPRSSRKTSQVRPASHAFCCFCAAVLTGAPHPCVRVRAFDSAQGGVPGRDGHRRRDGAGGDRGEVGLSIRIRLRAVDSRDPCIIIPNFRHWQHGDIDSRIVHSPLVFPLHRHELSDRDHSLLTVCCKGGRVGTS